MDCIMEKEFICTVMVKDMKAISNKEGKME
jgi:hypothetical protein